LHKPPKICLNCPNPQKFQIPVGPSIVIGN
jgi:hypothetical protein